MFKSLSDFPFTSHNSVGPDLDHTIYYIKFIDRVISIAVFDSGDFFVTSSNNPLYDPTSNDLNYSWDNTLTCDYDSYTLNDALKAASDFASSDLPLWDRDLETYAIKSMQLM